MAYHTLVKTKPRTSTEFQRFDAAVRQLLTVSKQEFLAMEAPRRHKRMATGAVARVCDKCQHPFRAMTDRQWKHVKHLHEAASHKAG